MGKVSHAQASCVLRSPKMAAGPASLVTSKWIRAAFAIATKLHLGNTSLNGRSFTRFSTKSALPVLSLYTKFQFEEVDIKAKGNEAWFEKYRYEIPVFHLNGSFLMKHRVNEEVLERELSKFEEQQRG